ncbi:hypothetical protein HYFRA_00001836 [Hymenoscyphus fraxineus]|uniref:Nephrocystin 3-like N-terminal domain-containing protein n=1 Tax=Hymenoscyphus fraxineus TaxID=746836 RepID=A0A9N9KJH6_9HELO|nr:hypothetical protein HYFRA_00001836 [Hymenoscyphus fraxineus]
MNGEPACAVSESEACHLRPKEVHAQVSVPMDYNHSEMVKLRPGDEDGYSKIRQVIERFVEKAPSVIQLRFKDNPRNQNHNTAGDKNTEPVHDMEHQSTQDCLKSLTCNNVKRDITPPYNNTCQWIQTNPKYQGWRRRLSGLLWMRGKPGSGKSTVMSYIQRNNDWKDPTENSSTAFYFFSGQGTSFQRSQIGLLQSLLHQIVSTVPSQLRRVEQVYEEKKRSGGNLELQWSLFELQDLFRQMFAFPDTPPIRLYIDALDEANEDSPSEVLFFFQSILENPATRLSICFTCRHFPNLGFHDPGLDIDVEQENTDDIITYIDHFLKSNSQSGGNNDWIVKEIAKKSNNIFQWVVMITSKVSKLQRSGSSEQSILNFLNSPNLDLGKLYRGTLEKIEPSDRPESLRLLQWMCFSLRSLTVDEIRYAMAINSTLPNTKHHRWEDSPTYIETMKARSRIHYLSGGLAELVPFCEFDSSTQQNVSAIEGVRLIHQSVLDFLLSEGLEFLSGKTFLSEQGHDFLAKSCLNYLTRVDVLRLSIKRSFVSFEGYTPKGCFHDKELIHKNSDPAKNLYICPDCTDLEPTNSRRSNLLQEFPLLGYAVDGLLRHAMLSEPEFDQTDLHKRLQNPLDIWGYINLLRSTLDSSKVDLSQTFFHVAANIGWSEAFVRNFNHSTPLDYLKQWNTENMYGQTPIWIAAAKGHVDVLKTIPLQARSICLNQTDKKGISVLVSALRGRHDDVIAFLLDGDAIDVNQRYSNGKTPLLDCAERGYAEGLERILGHPHLDINLQDPNGKTPLMICAEKGYQTGLQKILCHKNLNINFQDFEGKTALHIAVHCQNIEAVEGLMGCDLMMPADRFIQDHTGSTPLHVAVRDRNFEMVQTLLTYHTGDYNAAKVVYPGTHGGGLDYQDNCGNTAILIAMDDPPDYDIAHILADDHGADWRIENNNGYNVYDLAREKGEQDIIEMLEDTQITGTSPPPETTPSPETTPPHDGYTHTLGMEGLELDPTEAMPRDFMDLDGIPDIRGRKRQFEDILGMSEAQGHRNKSLRRS